MPPRQRNQGGNNATSPAAAPASAADPAASVPSAASHTTKSSTATSVSGAVGSGSSSKVSSNDAQAIVNSVWRNYVNKTDQRTKLLDVFMVFLVAVGALQFLYCVIGGNFPFNAFLSGFSATVGQFVLTASLRIQTNPENKNDFGSLSHERAFADYVFGSFILHFFCVNFIN
ncbi:Dolichyl-diphosphooligosaccharide--protein glycosyltransferase subunit dad1 [Lasiodiplodia hormozganensis]|uniref:Dolichyl-diphosphooligosaccharide--protein glycosyltransferase subunit OST2 n=1 Tax=Lasiodiplodia hormozganensis TaxID=869390 RepID=A0AA40D578_9PEZI|nr:Dolichyl-diphosphooligosaccharide--protein glycosyltransferase subunit dad1 [Lasiodiplodia hormozganensis]